MNSMNANLSHSASVSDQAPLRIAIIGSGPRGLSILERLAVVIREPGERTRAVRVTVVDPHQIGCGRIWRTDQPECFLMNTVAEEVSAFSGPPDAGPARPGAGPSLARWWQEHGPAFPGPNSYAPRAIYGLYMQFVFSKIQAALNHHGTLEAVQDAAIDLLPHDGAYRIAMASGRSIEADRVVLVPGHAVHVPNASERALRSFADLHAGLAVIAGDSAADMPLENIAPGSPVGVTGLGLSFYDVMAALTLGRGGRFVAEGERLRYVRSHREPLIVGGSRSGMLLLARGRNQKSADHRYEPAIFTAARVRALRERGRIDFLLDVVPLLLAEVNLVYYQTTIRGQASDEAAIEFRRASTRGGPPSLQDLHACAARFLGEAPNPIDLDRIAHPFSGRSFDSPTLFHVALLEAVRDDLANADAGNVDSPVKAALDVIRDTRSLVRLAVDFGGLYPASHCDAFQNWYVPRSAFLAAGPPRFRLQQAFALIEAGVLRVVGPGVQLRTDPQRGCFVMSSPQVAGSDVAVSTLIDARIPSTDILREVSPLTGNLLRRGVWTRFVNEHQGETFATGGVAVTRSPFHPIGRDGVPDRGLYVLGIPTEHTRWFMQAGSNRPGFWTDFFTDADAIVRHALATASNTGAGASAIEPHVGDPAAFSLSS